jgi:hypothetical protein
LRIASPEDLLQIGAANVGIASGMGEQAVSPLDSELDGVAVFHRCPKPDLKNVPTVRVPPASTAGIACPARGRPLYALFRHPQPFESIRCLPWMRAIRPAIS